MFTHGRPTIDLDGTWKFCPDPMQRCRSQKWWANPSIQNSSFPCWDPEGLWDITVPGTWKTQFDELRWYDGHAVYLKDFGVDKIPADHEAFLCFDGAIYAAEVYLNGIHAGAHDWGYSPWQLRVTELIDNRNRLFVLLENLQKADRVPGERHDWNNDGGLVGSVKLVWVPRAHVRNFKVATTLTPDTVSITVDIHLESRDRAATEAVTVRLPELGLETQIDAAVGTIAQVSFDLDRAQVSLWQPGNPKLYTIELTTRHETLADEVGLRQVRTCGTEILLNDEPIRLYGLCTHAEFKETGRAATDEGIALMLEHAKDLGVNFLRCAHYPFAERFGRAMDRAGIMWWEEVPAYWLSNMGDEGQRRLACGMMEDMVRRDWNRASIIIWSVSNECCYRNPANFAETNYAYWFEVVPLVRSLDSTRLLSCAEAGNHIAANPIWKPDQGDEFVRDLSGNDRWAPGHSDEWYALFDILAANFYVSEAEEIRPSYKQLVDLLKPFNKPMMLSEFGSMSLRGSDVPSDQLGSEVRHAAILRGSYDAFAELPELSGYCPWCLTDIRVPIHWRWYNRGEGVFRYGLLDQHWQKKEPVYAELKSCIADLKAKLGGA